MNENIYTKSIEVNCKRLIYRTYDDKANELQYVLIDENECITSKVQNSTKNTITIELLQQLIELKNNFPIK